MDGLDLSAIDQIDRDAFNGSPIDSDDGEEEMPLPECIGLDSALQDEEAARLKTNPCQTKQVKTRSERERELEVQMLQPDSLRRQILEQSLNSGNNKLVSKRSSEPSSSEGSKGTAKSHVMNIVEKAGMRGIDKERINEIIHEASKGSLFYKKQAQRQAEIHRSIEKMLNRVKLATPMQVENARTTCDKMVADLEKLRVFNRIIVHFDLDMFFAAVEIRDNPDLQNKPVAVGGDSMVSTSNYIARKFGVRAAMPGFIARKLCPELVLIKPNGFKYRQASSEVFSILEKYDPELTSMSLDEAYLDLTEYVKNSLEQDGLEHDEYYDGTLPKIWWTRASEVVEEIRLAIFEKTKLTCSAGIACNTLLAKISTDINKPDGQFMVEGYPADVIDFIRKTPVEKVSGIGKVSVQFLNALDIKTCGDIYEKRHFLPLVFYEINVKFYLRVAFGDGSTSIKSDEHRKSKSVERTFTAVKDTLVLLDKLDNICEELCTKYLKPYRIRGRTVTVKLKRNTFTTTTKSYSMLVPTNDKLVIYSAAKNLLLSEVANEPPEISYRLLGVKLSNLADDGVTTNQLTIDAMLRNQELSKANKSDSTVHRVVVEKSNTTSEMCPEEVAMRDELITQEAPMEMGNDFSDESLAQPKCDENNLHDQKSGSSQKRRLTSGAPIESFFQKRMKKIDGQSDEKDGMSSSQDKSSGSVVKNQFLSQEDDDDEFFDAANNETDPEPNQMSQREQRQNVPNSEDFQCPYCFKPYADFNLLEAHVDTCYLKTPIDANKSFFSQRSQTLSSQCLKTQAKPKTKPISSQSSSKKRGASIKSRTRASPVPPSQVKLPSSPPSSQTPKGRRDSSGLGSSSSSTSSFYQRFIDSNIESLTQAVNLEPLQCPYCRHGFLNFISLETHVMMCPKQKSG